MVLILTSIHQARDFHFLYQFSYGAGGDTIVEYENGKDIDMGDGIEYGLGVSFKLFNNANSNLDTTLMLGYSTTGSMFDDNYYMSKIPITLTEYYTYEESWRLGVGITYHTSHQGHKGNTSLENIEFDDAIGGVFSLGYVFGEEKKTYVAIKASIIDYDINDVTLKGNRFSIMMEQKF
jgi:hypothetical protein